MKFQLFFCLFFISLNCESQAVDSIKAKIFYNYYYTKDPVTKVKESESFILAIGNSLTKYFSYTKYKRDSIIEETARKGQSFESISHIALANSSATIIYRDVLDKTMSVATELVGDKYSYPEEFNFSWKVMADTMLVQGYHCQKAVTDFRGRQYIAWFTSSIPVSTGPWKFFGLPGLIMSVYDTDKYFVFECSGINFFTTTEDIFSMDVKGYTITTRERYYKQEDLYYQDPVEYLRNVKGYNFVITGGPEIKKRPAPLRLELN